MKNAARLEYFTDGTYSKKLRDAVNLGGRLFAKVGDIYIIFTQISKFQDLLSKIKCATPIVSFLVWTKIKRSPVFCKNLSGPVNKK